MTPSDDELLRDALRPDATLDAPLRARILDALGAERAAEVRRERRLRTLAAAAAALLAAATAAAAVLPALARTGAAPAIWALALACPLFGVAAVRATTTTHGIPSPPDVRRSRKWTRARG